MAQEMGFLLANGVYYVEEMVKRGVDVDEFAPKISFFCAQTHHIFEEVAKYRASRRLWARILKERFGAKKPSSMYMRLTAMMCPIEYQREQPELNLVRGAYAALAGALAGCQGMLNPAFDEVFDIPSEKGHRLALGTCEILAHETNVRKTVDPLGGSYYIEALTNQVEQALIQRMKEVEDRGGPIPALESGWEQGEGYKTMIKYIEGVESGEIPYVGRNIYVSEEPEEVELSLHHPDPETAQKQIAQLKKIKGERDNAKVSHCLDQLRQAARGTENLMPYLIEAAEAYTSLGEITETLKGEWGEYKEPIINL